MIHYTDPYLLNPRHPVTVNLIGVGGTGSQVLSSIARINYALIELGHPGLYVTAFDNDIVTESNCGRQLFSISDIGQNKASVLITRLNRFFGTDWKSIPDKYIPYSNSANIIISCVDNVSSRVEINHHFQNSRNFGESEKREIYWLDFGNAQNTGQVVLGSISNIKQPKVKEIKTISKLKTVAEIFDLTKVKDEDSGPSCSLAEALTKQDLFVNSTLAQLGCGLLWKLISSGSIDYQGLYMNLQTMNVNPIKL